MPLSRASTVNSSPGFSLAALLLFATFTLVLVCCFCFCRYLIGTLMKSDFDVTVCAHLVFHCLPFSFSVETHLVKTLMCNFLSCLERGIKGYRQVSRKLPQTMLLFGENSFKTINTSEYK